MRPQPHVGAVPGLQGVPPLPSLVPLLILLLACPGSIAASHTQNRKHVVELNDETFDAAVEKGTWMIDIYAPWCGHCRQLEPVWAQLASDLQDTDIKVAKIDGSKEKVLMRRFGANAFPSIYLLRDGQTWVYNEARTVPALREFAEGGYLKEEPLPFLRAPNSHVGKLLGKLYKIPGMLKEVYLSLKEEHGLSDVTIMLGLLAVPVIVGAAAICAVDGLYLRQARMGGEDEHFFHHQHQE